LLFDIPICGWKKRETVAKKASKTGHVRSCCRSADHHNTRVIVLPITHTAPQPPADGIELPESTRTRLGLDDGRSWVIVTEGNDFIWPGPDLRPVAGRGQKSVAYGFLPPRLFRAIRSRFVECYARKGSPEFVRRTE
jgi:hypothetical protein